MVSHSLKAHADSVLISTAEINISVCSSLKTLSLSARFPYDDAFTCRFTLDSLTSIFLNSPLSRAKNPVFASLVFKFRFTTFGSGAGEEDEALAEDEIAELRENPLDGALVGFVQNMGLSRITLGYSVEFDATRERAETIIAYMFPRLKEKGYLQLMYTPCVNIRVVSEYC